jgi:hypothetical protein
MCVIRSALDLYHKLAFLPSPSRFSFALTSTHHTHHSHLTGHRTAADYKYIRHIICAFRSLFDPIFCSILSKFQLLSTMKHDEDAETSNRLVIGLDYGTTYTGKSHTVSANPCTNYSKVSRFAKPPAPMSVHMTFTSRLFTTGHLATTMSAQKRRFQARSHI